MNKSPELEKILKEFEGVYFPDSHLEELDNFVEAIPGVLEKIKSMDSKNEKWNG